MSETKLWRDLEIGELILPTDEFMDSRHGVLQWKSCYNHSAEPLDAIHVPHRRRVPASPIIRDARTDPPKESDAQNGFVIGCLEKVWRFIDWNSNWFRNSNSVYWFALPPIPEPEKSEAELAFEATYSERNFKDVIERGMTVDYNAVFVRAYEMGKAAK